MSLDDQLKQTFESRLDAVDISAGDVDAARHAGRRMQVRRRVVTGAAVLAVVAAGVAGTVVSSRPDAAGPSAPLGHWRELPTPPLSPRAEARAVWTGGAAIVLGGVTEVCPPNADCASPSGHELRDGAAYDPRANVWRPIPPAPIDVSGAQLVVADGVVVLEDSDRLRSRWYAYVPDHDHWDRIHHVSIPVGDDLSAYGHRVYVSAGRRVAVYDVRSFQWSLLPPDRVRPALTQRTVTATSSGPVVTGYDATQPHDGTEPSLVLADVWDGTAWRRLPPSDQLQTGFSWTGHRLVNASPFTENGGEVNGWGRDIPEGGTLDPATGTWGRLPAALTGDPGGWSVSADGQGWFATAGQIYDDDSGRVYTLDRPDGAPDAGVTGVWAGDRLLAFGGTDSAQGLSGDALSNRAWLWSP